MNLATEGTLKSLLIPGGILLLAAAVLLQSGLVSVPVSAVNFFYYVAFAAGLLLAWRFHSGRVLFVLITLLLARRAIEFFAAGQTSPSGPGRVALEAVAFLLPLNFTIASLARERGVSFPVIVPRLFLLFFESVFVAVICRPGGATVPAFLHTPFLGRHLSHWTPLPPLAWLALVLALGILLIRAWLRPNSVDSGLFWALLASLLFLQTGGTGRLAGAYLATAALVLLSSIVENSYFLAYHDELTGLPARRAFNDAILHLREPYAIAAVDIDHFKSVNDTYGHETGDQVLRSVAARLMRVTGGGQAFRVGGEEFSIVFAGKSAKEALPHLDLLRSVIEQSAFHLRGSHERRGVPRGADRRGAVLKAAARKSAEARAPQFSAELSVTVSIGVAGSSLAMKDVERIIEAADRALYHAKHSGRNRVESAFSRRKRASKLRRSIA